MAAMTIPSLRDVPDRFDSPRLTIRCPQSGDGPRVHDAIVASLDALREFPASLPWAMAEPTLASAEQFCREGRAHFMMRSMMPMLLLLKGSDTLVGVGSLHAFDWAVPKCEIGYWAHSAFTGRGFVTEAAQAITDLAFGPLGMRRVEALPDAGNIASWRVCERAGYTLEGTRRNDRITPDGMLRDSRVYARIR